MLQLLVNFIYSLIKNSWVVSAVLVKYILVINLAYALNLEGRLLENFREIIQKYSKETVSGLVILGFLSIFSGFTINPIFELLSYSTAVLYFGYLFWKF